MDATITKRLDIIIAEPLPSEELVKAINQLKDTCTEIELGLSNEGALFEDHKVPFPIAKYVGNTTVHGYGRAAVLKLIYNLVNKKVN